MLGDRVGSDQLLYWSEHDARNFHENASAKTKNSASETAPAERRSSRLVDRALQALRQARLQMRAGPGAWPEVLSFGQPIGEKAGDGLRSSRLRARGQRTSGQPQENKTDPGRTVRDQSRDSSPQRTIVEGLRGFLGGCRDRNDSTQRRRDRRCPCKHARGRGADRPRRTAGLGGAR